MTVDVRDALLNDSLYTVEMRVQYCQVFCIKAAVRTKDSVKVVQRITLRWYGHVLRQDDDDWMQKCVNLEFEGARRRGKPRKTRKDVVDKDVNDLRFKPSDAVDRSKRTTRKLATAHRSRISIRDQPCKTLFLTCSLITALNLVVVSI